MSKKEKKPIDKKKFGKTVLYWVVLNLGILCTSAGVYFFKAPNNFATGGVSGLAILIAEPLHRIIPDIPQTELMTILNAALNVLLLLIGFIFLGKGCTLKTAYCTLMSALETWLLKFVPIDLPITNQTFLEFCYGMLLTSAGSAVLFSCNASSGGTDIIALIVKKFTKISVGTSLMFTDFIIAASAFFVFSDPRAGLYSLLGLFVKSVLVDTVIDNITRTKCVTIITANPKIIEPFILQGIHRGLTEIEGVGGYTGGNKSVLLTVCKRNEAIKLKIRIHAADPEAFVILTNANEILGKGFNDFK